MAHLRQFRFFHLRGGFINTMSKRIIAILLCAVMLIPCLASCSSSSDEDDLGAYITMYLTDDIYDFDPANAYYNTDTLNVVSLMFDTLFTLNEDGKVKKSLVDDYEFLVDQRTGEHYMELTLKETYWSNGTQLSADDVAFAWRRLLTSTNDYAAASLLYDIKNARAVKEGDVSIDNVGIEAVGVDTLKITFEDTIDYDQFLLNLTSVATAPLLENYVSKNPDWAKKPSTMVTSGAFKLGKINYTDILDEKEKEIQVEDEYYDVENGKYKTKKFNTRDINFFYLERNLYYFRDIERDTISSSVTPYRILVDCSKTDAEILADYQAGKLFYVGNIPLSLRGDAYVQENVEISNALSTFVLYMNEYAIVDDGATGSTLFDNAKVRQALSLAIDRNAIAQAIVYAEAATGLVSPGVFENGKVSKNDFRTVGGDILATSANASGANALLSEAGIDATKYSFSIKVPTYDEVQVKMAEMVAEAWNGLGFKVTVEAITPIQNNDYYKEVSDYPTDVCDDLFIEALQENDYDVIAFDYTAYSADAYSMLSNFALAFSGMGLNITTSNGNTSYLLSKNSTGYMSMEYNNIMEAIYYIPYFANIDNSTSDYLKEVKTQKPYVETATLLAQTAASIAGQANTDAATAMKKLNDTAVDYNEIISILSNTTDLMKQANLEISRSYEVSAQTYTKQSEIDTAVQNILAATSAAQTAANTYNADKKNKEAAEALTNALNNAVTVISDSVTAVTAIAAEAEAAAANADQTTLYDIIAKIYSDNGITPSKKSSDWTKQKNTLLHKAETILMADLPVIPVVFNQNAVLVSKELSKVTPTYYIPAYFRKTNLKNYKDYTYVDEKSGETTSIFADFPTISWDKIGK